MVKGDAAEALGLVRLVDADQVIEWPHAFGELRLSEDPAAAETAQTVHLGEAVGRDELRSEMNRTPARRDGGVKVDFVDHHARTDPPGKLSDRAQLRFAGE